jgi:hypothetical protein
MPATFTSYSNFNENANYSTIKFGSDALMLEVELNEMQNILENKIKTFLIDRVGNGFYGDTSTLTYAAGTLTLSNAKAILNGYMINISSLSIALAEGQTAYLDVWQEDVTYQSTIKLYGNQQETNNVTNSIKDSRVSEETTRRIQTQYNIVKTTGVSGHSYLPIATITSGVVVDNRTALTAIGGGGSGGSGMVTKTYSSFTASTNGTTNCPIGVAEFNKDTDILDVYYEGAKQSLTDQYTINANGTSIDLAGFSLSSGEAVKFEIIKNVITDVNSAVQDQLDQVTADINTLNAAIGGMGSGYATLTGAETLTNKTLTAPKISTAGYIADENSNEQIKFSTTASAVNEITVQNAATANAPQIQATGGDTNVSLNLVSKGTGTIQANGVSVVTTSGTQTLSNKTLTAPVIASGDFIKDANGNEIVKFTSNINAINYLEIAAAQAGGTVQLNALGDAANVGIAINTKGTGAFYINGYAAWHGGNDGIGSGLDADFLDGQEASYFANLTTSQTLVNKTLTAPKFVDTGYIADSNGNELVKFSVIANAVNEITVKNAAATNSPQIQATGSDTNIDINIIPKGTGTLKVNGNPVAINALDGQTLSLGGLPY